MISPRRARTLLLYALPAALAYAAPARADNLTGQIVLLKEALPPNFASDKDLASQLKKARVMSPDKEGESWQLRFVAFFKKPVDSDKVKVVFYSLAGKKPEYVTDYDVNLTSGQKSLQTELKLTESDGLKSGKKYSLRVTRLINGKEEIYAQTTVTLK
jgi:hypothetical protein